MANTENVTPLITKEIGPNCPFNTKYEEKNTLETYMLNIMFISPCIRTTNNKYGKCYTSDYD